MPRKPRAFPIALRACTIALALIAGLLTPVPAPAEAAPTAQQVHDAKTRVDALVQQMQQAQATLDSINRSLQAATVAVDKQEAALEKIRAQLLATQASLDLNQAHYDAIMSQLNQRATQAFMDGPASNLGFILGATSMGDLSDRIEFVSVIAENDAGLAQDVANTKSQLQSELDALVQLRAQQQDALAKANQASAQIAASFAAQAKIVDYIAAKKARAEKIARRLSTAYQAWLSQQGGWGYGGGHHSVPMPPGWDKVILACPVNGPRSFTDGFGAPRYTGGFHLHAGNDIMAPRGTPIVASFDGTAHKGWSTLGGNEVFVYGPYGYSFNAHLNGYSSHSEGPVHTGDVIGYVGDTGDAIGTHDHFEFHPYVMPNHWPASPYGYSVIGTAIDPYPLLVAACG
jgi:murein DD-endopeptidase MepM/ murein hydrolase activator NlpD